MQWSALITSVPLNWVSLATAIFSFARAFIKYMEYRDGCRLDAKTKARKLRDYGKAMKKAKEEGNTDELEDLFTMLVPADRLRNRK